MKDARLREDPFYRNLLDAGCGEETADTCLALLGRGNTAELLRTLCALREQLLEELHSCEQKLEALDYLVFRIKNKN